MSYNKIIIKIKLNKNFAEAQINQSHTLYLLKKAIRLI